MDLKRLQKGNIILATAEQWDRLSLRWRKKRTVSVTDISLFIADELHLLGATGGPTLEVVVSRMRAISKLLSKPIRVVGLGSSMADGKEVGDWLGAPSHTQFCFPPGSRPVPLEIHIQSMDIANFEARMQVTSPSCHRPPLLRPLWLAAEAVVLKHRLATTTCGASCMHMMYWGACAGDVAADVQHRPAIRKVEAGDRVCADTTACTGYRDGHPDIHRRRRGADAFPQGPPGHPGAVPGAAHRLCGAHVRVRGRWHPPRYDVPGRHQYRQSPVQTECAAGMPHRS